MRKTNNAGSSFESSYITYVALDSGLIDITTRYNTYHYNVGETSHPETITHNYIFFKTIALL